MENSGVEALIIGVNILIFVAALSIAIMLMINVLNMSNTANDIIKLNNKGSLVETKNVDYTKVISGQELLKYYTKNIENVLVEDAFGQNTLTNHISTTSNLRSILTKKYKIGMEEIGGIDTFVFKEI